LDFGGLGLGLNGGEGLVKVRGFMVPMRIKEEVRFGGETKRKS
jgi:hypothetical protein